MFGRTSDAFFRCLVLLSGLGFDVTGLMFGGWVCSFGVGGNVVLGSVFSLYDYDVFVFGIKGVLR